MFNPIAVYGDGDGIFWAGEPLRCINFYRKIDYSKLYQCSFIPGKNQLVLTKGIKRKTVEIHCAINCMHGRYGEDGTLVGMLRLCNIPFVSPDLFASALSIDKDLTKVVMDGIGVKTAPYVRIKRSDFFKKSQTFIKFVAKRIGFPCIVKPSRLGSSIGIEKVDNEEKLFGAICQAFNYDDKIICEPYLPNARDLNCAVYKVGDKIRLSEIEEAMKKSEILSFADKYGGGEKAVGCDRRKAVDLPADIVEQIKKYCKDVYRKLDFSSIVRFDFLLSNGCVYLNEINAVPGSLAYYLFCNKMEEFSELITQLVNDAVDVKRKEDNYLTFYSSKILHGDYTGIKK